MRIIDTHCHLDMVGDELGLEEVLEGARESGVERIVTIGASSGMQSNRRALELATRHEGIRATAGIHPHEADGATDARVEELRDDFLEDDQVVAVGETGLDFHYENSTRENQIDAFRTFLEFSRQLDKPVVIHSREAEAETIELLDETGVQGGILHCFSGSASFAEALLEREFYLSFSGLVTFVDELREIAARVPSDRILFETDAPFLAPTPRRGETNRPGFLPHTAGAIAEAREVELEELTETVWENARRVFDWP